MKKIFKIVALFSLIFIFLFSFVGSVNAGWVNGYYKSNSTYVNGYYRSDPNGLKYDNYGWSSGDSLYNSSYYDYGRGSNWYTPSWEWQDDYYTGLNYYNNSNYDYDYGYDSYDYYDYDYDYDSYDYYGW